MKISKYFMLSLLICAAMSNGLFAMSTKSAELNLAVSALKPTKLKNGNYTYNGRTFTAEQLVALYEDSMIGRPEERPTKAHAVASPLLLSPSMNPVHEYGPKDIAAMKKNIAQVHQNMLQLVDQIAKTDLNKKYALLQNILTHEEQSERSLQDHQSGARNYYSRYRPVGQFPGCPACG